MLMKQAAKGSVPRWGRAPGGATDLVQREWRLGLAALLCALHACATPVPLQQMQAPSSAVQPTAAGALAAISGSTGMPEASPTARLAGSAAPAPSAGAQTTVSTAGSASSAGRGPGAPASTGSDTDADGVVDAVDNCPSKSNPEQNDQDGDEIGDACDNCLKLANADQRDSDMSGVGDACECENPTIACENGMAGPYPCSKVDMLGRVTLEDMGARSGNAIWGGVESAHGREIGVVGLDNGTAFVDLSRPNCPTVLGVLPSTTSRSPSRDVKVLGDYALVVAEIQNHGMQIFDMRTLGTTGTSKSTVLMPTMVYKGTSDAPISNAHNIVVNEETKMIYIVGSKSCKGGLHMVDFKDPQAPKFLGCGNDQWYVHDALCLIYKGPDTTYKGHELCLTFNGEQSAFSVFDLNDKTAPKLISTTKYDGGAYTHQGWFTEDQSYLLLQDELDEQRKGDATRTYLFNMLDLDKPVAMTPYTAQTKATDHNVYILGPYAYQSSYTAGMRILDVRDVAAGKLSEVGFFDTMPSSDTSDMKSAWTAFPYFKSGVVIVGTIESGMFILSPQRAALVGNVAPP